MVNWRLKEPVSALTHLAGALLSVVGLVLLMVQATRYGTAWHVVSFAVFGASLILLYGASAAYHWARASERVGAILKRLDHMMIFVLIAGTYTPFCLLPLRGPWGWALFGTIWGLAVAGIVLKACWPDAPRWLSTGIYVLMGWMIVVALVPLLRTTPAGTVGWLVAGGVAYTVGAVIYATEWPNPVPRWFGFHEIWHLFVMAGSFGHYWAVFRYMILVG
jgi:hemolysin III